MTAGPGDRRQGPEIPHVGLGIIEGKIGLRRAAWGAAQGKVDIADLPGLQVLRQPFAGIAAQTFGPEREKPFRRQPVHAAVKRDAPARRIGRNLAIHQQGTPLVADLQPADLDAKRVELQAEIAFGDRQAHRLRVEVRRIRRQILQPDLADQVGQLAGLGVDAQRGGTAGLTGDPTALHRKLVEPQQHFGRVVGEIAARALEGDRRGAVVGTHGARADVKARRHRRQLPALIQPRAYRTGYRRLQHTQPGKGRALGSDIARRDILEGHAEIRRPCTDLAGVVRRERGGARAPAQQRDIRPERQGVALPTQQKPPAVHRPGAFGARILVAQGDGAQLDTAQIGQRRAFKQVVHLADQIRQRRGLPGGCKTAFARLQRHAAVAVALEAGDDARQRDLARLYPAVQKGRAGEDGADLVETGDLGPGGRVECNVPQPQARAPPLVHQHRHFAKAQARLRQHLCEARLDPVAGPVGRGHRIGFHIEDRRADAQHHHRGQRQRRIQQPHHALAQNPVRFPGSGPVLQGTDGIAHHHPKWLCGLGTRAHRSTMSAEPRASK